jgi:regulator of protease activity HflC (stomatin/prohibitin superfamily)
MAEKGIRDLEKGFFEGVGIQEQNRKYCKCGCIICGLPALFGLIVLFCSITSLGPEEQLLLITDGGTGKKVVNGPSTELVSPFKKSEIRKATRLSPQQFAKVKNARTGLPRHESGPMLLWLEAWDELIAVKPKIVLQAREYTRLVDSYTGLVRVEVGPQRIVPGVYEDAPQGIQKATPVTSTESLVVLNKTSGRKRLVREEGFFIPGSFEEVIEERNATVLKEKEYAVVRNTLTGEYRHEEGAQLLFVGAYDEVVNVRSKIVLQKQEYVRLVDHFTGYARVVVGPVLMVPNPSEDGPGGIDHTVQKANIISSQISVVLFNRTSGKKYEVREEGIFVPGPYEDVLEVRRATVLKSQEYAVVKNELTGKYLHYPGPQQLFVSPYEQLFRVLPKVVLQKQDYVRLVDRRTGEENVVKGPQAVVPEPTQCEKDYSKNCSMEVTQAIVMKADVAVLTLNKTTGVKRIIRADAGGIFTPQPYEEVLEVRKATVLKQQEYAVVKNNRNGSFRHAAGPTLLHLEAYEELVRVTLKAVLHKFEYIRLVNELTGIERVVEGPVVIVPDPTEVSVKGDNHSKIHHEMVQQAVLIDKDHAVLVLNQATGQQRLVTDEGMWTPAPYEHLLEKRSLIRVLANEAVVVRDYEGVLTVHDGTAGGAGTVFFLPARSQIASMTWTVYAMPGKQGNATVTQATIDKIDMRIQRTFYSYAVRTSDNVELMLMGTIFWRVENVTKMILGTSDPSGDVWHHCRSSFMQAVSNTTFDSFMGSFNNLAKDAYYRDVSDGFYTERGVSLLSMEVTRFEAVDSETKATLKKINEETTNQITLLKKQEGENAVRAAKMRSDIALAEEQTQAELRLEGQKTSLIETRVGNDLLQKKADAEGDAQPFAQHAKTFIEALNETGVSVSSGLGLYRVLQEAEHHNEDTKNIASGNAQLFLTSNDVKLNLRNLNLGSFNSSSQSEEYPSDL